jgi:hypothetical protein
MIFIKLITDSKSRFLETQRTPGRTNHLQKHLCQGMSYLHTESQRQRGKAKRIASKFFSEAMQKRK